MTKKARMEVIATEKGYYDEKVREVGDIFEIHDEQELGSWMEPTKGGDKEAVSSARSAGGTKVVARNGENVVTEASSEAAKKAALKNADPKGDVM